MNIQEVLDYVEEVKKYGVVPGLFNIEQLCEKLGTPQDELKFIHIAGTNGKGSVLSFCSEILKASGVSGGKIPVPGGFGVSGDYTDKRKADKPKRLMPFDGAYESSV